MAAQADQQQQNEATKLVDQAMAQAQASLEEVTRNVDAEPPAADLGLPASADIDRIDLLSDVDLHVVIELGRTQMLVEDVLRLSEGSVVELDKLAGDPVDVYVNHRLVARGEVLVLNDNFCIRVSEILDDLEEHAEAAIDAQPFAAGGEQT